MDSLGGVAYKGPLCVCVCKQWFYGDPPPKKEPINIASAHIHIPRNKCLDNPMDSLGDVDNRFQTDRGTDGRTKVNKYALLI